VTTVEKVLTLKQIDLLQTAGPRHLLALADLVREVDMTAGQTIYNESDLADAIYVVHQGRVRLFAGAKELSTVGPGEAFGTWALVDDSQRGQRAECAEDGLLVALAGRSSTTSPPPTPPCSRASFACWRVAWWPWSPSGPRKPASKARGPRPGKSHRRKRSRSLEPKDFARRAIRVPSRRPPNLGVEL